MIKYTRATVVYEDINISNAFSWKEINTHTHYLYLYLHYATVVLVYLLTHWRLTYSMVPDEMEGQEEER